jgi:hypothetical protein
MKSIKNLFFTGLIALAIIFGGCKNPTGGGDNGGEGEGDGGVIEPVPAGLSLAGSLEWLRINAVSGGNYAITLITDEAIAPHELDYGGDKVRITITGASRERTVSLSSTGTLFTIESGVTLTLGNNVTLDGSVYVQDAGMLVMNSGSKIIGNNDNDSTGVVVDGTFTMNGGEISDNGALDGGGVYVNGTFTMNGGNISRNDSHFDGGGVYVNGTFTMNGGEISGNDARNGGGVYINSGTFTMSGGEINGNWASNGGGVYISDYGTFTISGGKISVNITFGTHTA